MAPQVDPIPPRRASEREIAFAIDLGWRVAALHALSPATLVPPAAICDDMLLNRRSLPAPDRLELELRAIAGVAQHVGVPLGDEELKALFDLTPGAAQSLDGEEVFRGALARLHISIEKRLWAGDESQGRAYELGSFISDTWNRVLRPRTTTDPESELVEIFSPVRIGRMKLLLDDLQARLDPVAVHAVENHLDAWCARIPARGSGGGGAAAAAQLTHEETAATYEPVERQTIIWRQMLTGAKEPEAYIDHDKRAQVRDELTGQLWQRYRRYWWVVPIVAVVGAVVGILVASDSIALGPVIGTLTAVAGMFGITRASMTVAVKRGLQNWGELMWNRSLAAVICRETLVVDALPPPPRA